MGEAYNTITRGASWCCHRRCLPCSRHHVKQVKKEEKLHREAAVFVLEEPIVLGRNVVVTAGKSSVFTVLSEKRKMLLKWSLGDKEKVS